MKRARLLLFVLATWFAFGGLMTALAQSSVTTTTGTVQVTDDGIFTAQLCFSANFKDNGADPGVTSSSGAVASGWTMICYVDSHVQRRGFTATLHATDFISITPGISASIPVENLFFYRSVRPRMDVGTIIWPDAGMIYAVSNQGSISTYAGVNGNSAWWTPRTWDLSTPRVVGRADAGRGMSNNGGQIRAGIYFDLVVPAGQRPATYRSQFTLTVTPVSP